MINNKLLEIIMEKITICKKYLFKNTNVDNKQ